MELQRPSEAGASEDTKTLVSVLLLIFVYPVGVLVMWLWPKWALWVKALVSLPLVLLAVGFISLAAGLISFFAPMAIGPRPPDAASGAASAPSASTVASVTTYTVPSRNHSEGVVNYPQTPPVGGDHNPTWQNCGFYSSPIRNETAVHSMEHGAIWITYKQDLPQDQVNRIRQLATSQPFLLASPYPDLPSGVVVSAWGRQVRLNSADEPQLEQSIQSIRQSTQTPEPGAPCSGGVGTPR